MVNYWLNINQILLPEQCNLCRSHLNDHSSSGLCSSCIQNLPWLEAQLCCQRCSLPLSKITNKATTLPLCGQCQQKSPAFDACYCLFHYQPPVDKLISRFKFNQQLSYARAFGLLMAEQIKLRYQPSDLPNEVIPVPLHRKRLRERGFNQAEELARFCAKALNLSLNTKQCLRDKSTEHQLGLSGKERRRNLRGAFSSKPFKPGTKVALVDDVMTTGTTLNELATCLKKAGCDEVHLWCIARAHRP